MAQIKSGLSVDFHVKAIHFKQLKLRKFNSRRGQAYTFKFRSYLPQIMIVGTVKTNEENLNKRKRF